MYSSPIFARYWHSENVSPPTGVIVPSLSMRVFDFWLASAPTATGTSLALIICRLGVGLGLGFGSETRHRVKVWTKVKVRVKARCIAEERGKVRTKVRIK